MVALAYKICDSNTCTNIMRTSSSKIEKHKINCGLTTKFLGSIFN